MASNYNPEIIFYNFLYAGPGLVNLFRQLQCDPAHKKINFMKRHFDWLNLYLPFAKMILNDSQ
jgi:hypothetical protein